MKKTKEQKTKGIANIILMIGISLVIGGGVIGFSNITQNEGEAFFMCLIGTILNFTSGYIKHGYIKFFN